MMAPSSGRAVERGRCSSISGTSGRVDLWDMRKFRLDIGNRLLTMRALEQRSGHSSKADRVQAVSEQCSQ